jgi:hypothetical protein
MIQNHSKLDPKTKKSVFKSKEIRKKIRNDKREKIRIKNKERSNCSDN